MKRLKQLGPAPLPQAREDVIVFVVGGFKLAIAASVVKEIRGLDGMHAFTLGGIAAQIAKLKYTMERNGTTYFVIDAAQHFQLAASQASRVLVLRNGPIGILVDSTDRITEISSLHALPQAFTHEERGWYRGLAVVNGSVVPVVNHNAFLNRAELEILRDGLERVRGIVTVGSQ